MRFKFSLLLLLGFTLVSAQTCNVDNIVAYGMTASESYDKALALAQQEIISQCGGGINVTSSSLYSISENEKGEVLDAFNESISLGLSGVIRDFRIYSVQSELIEGGQIRTTLSAKGKVDPDLSTKVDLRVLGLKESYFEGDWLSFTLSSNLKGGYAYVFQSVNNRVDLICPNQVQSGRLDNNGNLSVPNDSYSLRVKVDEADMYKEVNTFYIIVCDRSIPFNGGNNAADLIEWYNQLPPKSRGFSVQKATFNRR
jgi:hypothetical protein